MLRHSLIFEQVILPRHPKYWPFPLDLQLGLQEILLLEGTHLGDVLTFLQVAATLRDPHMGRVLHWGSDNSLLPRTELFRLRRRIALIAPGQVLLQKLSLRENLALYWSYHKQMTVAAVLDRYRDLLNLLDLEPYLDLKPLELSPDLLLRGVIARELVKGPELILASLDGPAWTEDNKLMFREALEDYREGENAAVFLAGRHLAYFHTMAHRLLQVGRGRFLETRLEESREQTPVTFLKLV